MPAVAVMLCSGCGAVTHRPLSQGDNVPLMSACACGGRKQVARFFSDRRKAVMPVPVERRREAAQPVSAESTGSRAAWSEGFGPFRKPRSKAKDRGPAANPRLKSA